MSGASMAGFSSPLSSGQSRVLRTTPAQYLAQDRELGLEVDQGQVEPESGGIAGAFIYWQRQNDTAVRPRRATVVTAPWLRLTP